MRLELHEYVDSDLPLSRQLETDERVMHHLGGAFTRAAVRQNHRRRLRSVAVRAAWYFTIHPEDVECAVGTIGVWPSSCNGADLNEIGWMVLPAFQGRGYATAATRLVLERAKFEQRWRIVHAFPAVNNIASNAICCRLGFTLLGTVRLSYRNQTHLANDYGVELFPPAQ